MYIGGFPYEITEGDLIIVFSQYGEIVDCRIVRDKETGKSKGFGFICYEDQKSTILAVDNLNGSDICGRIIRVDHVEQFKIPREYFELDNDEINGEKAIYKASGPDGKGWGDDRLLSHEDLENFNKIKQNEQERQIKQTKLVQGDILMDQDERWEKEFKNLVNMHKNNKDEDANADEKNKQRKKDKKDKKEKKRLKKEEKEFKKNKNREDEAKQILEYYGVKNIPVVKQNLSYVTENIPANNKKIEEI